MQGVWRLRNGVEIINEGENQGGEAIVFGQEGNKLVVAQLLAKQQGWSFEEASMSCSLSMRCPTMLLHDKKGRSKPKRKKNKGYLEGNEFNPVRSMRRKIMEGTFLFQA